MAPLSAHPTDLPLVELNANPTAYLVPDCEDDEDRKPILAHFYDIIFERELAGWWTVKADWSKKRDRATFKRWFDYEYNAVVVDLVEEPLEEDELI